MINDDELNDLLKDSVFNLTEEEISLFSFPTELKVKEKREKADYIAQRTVCEEFAQYEPLFKQVHAELKNGQRSLVKYNVHALKEKTFYMISGTMIYLEALNIEKNNKRHNPDGRTHVIYENGMESDIKVHTLAKNVYTDGFVITEPSITDQTAFKHSFNVEADEKETGWIYVLRSLSEHEEVASQKNLYKIGFSTTPVADRIKNCEYEPTYLMDKVEVVATWKTYDIITQRFEALLHQFLSTARFRMKVYDMAGVAHEPKEWFVVPLPIIKAIIEHIMAEDIMHYRYNSTLQLLEMIEEEEPTVESEKVDTTGWHILSLIIKDVYFKEILSGTKTIEYRELKQNRLGTYTFVDKDTGVRYLKKFDALRLYVGYSKDRDSALVEVIDTQYDADERIISYYLGKVIEVSVKRRIDE